MKSSMFSAKFISCVIWTQIEKYSLAKIEEKETTKQRSRPLSRVNPFFFLSICANVCEISGASAKVDLSFEKYLWNRHPWRTRTLITNWFASISIYLTQIRVLVWTEKNSVHILIHENWCDKDKKFAENCVWIPHFLLPSISCDQDICRQYNQFSVKNMMDLKLNE